MDNTTSAAGARTRALAIALVTMTLLAGVAAGGCSRQPKVSYAFDSKTDFAALKTYAMQPTDSPTLAMRMLDGKPMAETIAARIGHALEARGLRPAAASGPAADVLVRWTARITYDQVMGDVGTPGADVSFDAPDSGFMLDSAPPGEGTPDQVALGGLRIDLAGARVKHVVWRGHVFADLHQDAPDPKRVARLDAALAKLFANYPPKPAAATAAR
jgi:hypothetical protein